MSTNRIARQSDLTGCRVLILAGTHNGKEGVCVGEASDGKLWAVSPDDADEILELLFEKEFALLIDLSGDPERN